MVEAGVRVFSDDGHCVPDGARAPQRAHVREGVRRRGRDRRALRGRLARRGRADARGARTRTRSGSPGGPREAEEVVVARDLAIARLTGGRLHLCHLSSARLGRAGPAGQGRGPPRHRRGHAAPPRVHRRRPRHLRHELQGEPAAAHGRGSRRAPRRARRRHDRRVATDHAPARGGGEGGRVRPGAAGDDRARDRARGGADRTSSSPGTVTLARAIEAMSSRPPGSSARPTTAGRSRPGAPANLVVFDPDGRVGRSSRRSRRRRGTRAFLGRELARPGRATRCSAGTLTVADGKAHAVTGTRRRSSRSRTARVFRGHGVRRRGRDLRRGGLQHRAWPATRRSSPTRRTRVRSWR